jgi:hypothetical protein
MKKKKSKSQKDEIVSISWGGFEVRCENPGKKSIIILVIFLIFLYLVLN